MRLDKQLRKAIDYLVTRLSYQEAADECGIDPRRMKDMALSRGDFSKALEAERNWQSAIEKMKLGKDWAIVESMMLFENYKKKSGAVANNIMKSLAELCGWSQPTMILHSMDDIRNMDDKAMNARILELNKSFKKATAEDEEEGRANTGT